MFILHGKFCDWLLMFLPSCVIHVYIKEPGINKQGVLMTQLLVPHELYRRKSDKFQYMTFFVLSTLFYVCSRELREPTSELENPYAIIIHVPTLEIYPPEL